MVVEGIGDVIKAAVNREINVIVHGCNCFCTMKRGIAVEMAKTFNTHLFPSEFNDHEGDINKLGQIDFKFITMPKGNIWVVNAYTQYHWSTPGPYNIPFDYDAFRLCFRKINSIFKKEDIGIPGLLGAGLAQGKPNVIRAILEEECKNCKIIIYYPETI